VVLSTSGTVLIPSASAYSPAALPPAVNVGGAALRGALGAVPSDNAYMVARDASGQHQLVVLMPIVSTADQTTVALLQISTSTTPIVASVTATRLVLALGIAVTLGIAAALTFPLMSAGLRPLVAMERASRRIAAGAMSLRLEEPPTNDEIGQLARSFNSMVEQLEAAFARQKRFVADVSHELRTPLTALSGELEMLLLGADRGKPEATRRLARGMYAEVGRLHRLVADLLTLTRLDEGRAELRDETIDLAPMLRDVAERAEHLAHGQRIHLAVSAPLPLVHAEADRTRQVLLNLVENALKYTPPAGDITLRARPAAETKHDAEGMEEDEIVVEDMTAEATEVDAAAENVAEVRATGWVEVEIADSGVGIAPEALPHVFERFYRADPARAHPPKRSGGAGLGLSIAKSLIEAQGGEISVASELGRGTTVTIRFPAAGKHTVPDAVLAEPRPV
jgi:two-component system OmpR family sensor kinase